jgi:telomerase reverse transcriptase
MVVDVLNRYSDHRDKKHTSHVLKYIFPRQFGLHNAFSSVVDRRETVQPFQDYTLREQEITTLEENKYNGHPIPVPKRLKGNIMNMVAKLQQLQKDCPYHALIKHYCPVFVSLPLLGREYI